MKWLVVQEAEGPWESIKLDEVESIAFDGKGGVWIGRRGAPPKGVADPAALYLADEPAVEAPHPIEPDEPAYEF